MDKLNFSMRQSVSRELQGSVAIVKKRLNLPGSLHTILQILEVNIFQQKSIFQAVSYALKHELDGGSANQLILFD